MKPKVRPSLKNATVSNCLIPAKQDREERADGDDRGRGLLAQRRRNVDI